MCALLVLYYIFIVRFIAALSTSLLSLLEQ